MLPLALASAVVLLVVHLLLALSPLPAELVLAGLGLGYSVFAAVIWPGVAYVVEPAELAEKFRIARGKGKGTKRSALEAEVATGRVDRCTGGPLLGLDPNKRYMVFPGAHMTKDALGRHTISYA